VLRTWWWPAYAFLYPLLFWPHNGTNLMSFRLHAALTLVAVAGGALLEIGRPGARASAGRGGSLRRALAHPAPLLACLFAAWVIVAALFAPEPVFALTGALGDLRDGALWMALLVIAFLLVYVRGRRDPALARRLAWAVSLAAAILVVGAIVEVVLGRGLLYPIRPGATPMLNFPQRGHLAGMLALAGGAAMAVAPTTILPLIAFGIGTTLTRAAMVALLVAALVPLLLPRRSAARAALLGGLVVVGLAGGWGLAALAHRSHKDLESTRSLHVRTYFYRAAVNGIAARPLLGWGGGNFPLVWPRYLTKDQLQGFVEGEWGFPTTLGVSVDGVSWPVLAVLDKAGHPATLRVAQFKVHDQLLEAAILWGVPGAACYLALVVLALTGLRRRSAAAWGLLAYAVFLILWFVIPQTQGVVWVMLGAAAADGAAVRAASLRPRTGRTVQGPTETY